MAQRIARLDPVGRKTRYPWYQWMDGDAWELEAGIDFDVATRTMQSNALAIGRSRDMAVRTVVRRDTSRPGAPERWLQVQFYPSYRYGQAPEMD